MIRRLRPPGLLLLALLLAACGRPEAPPVAEPPTGCLACHEGQGPADPLHGPLPCELCHGGDPRARTAEVAHLDLEKESGALATVDRTCGQAACHAREAERVRGSMMATARGIVAVDRFAFGETPAVVPDRTMAEVLAKADPSPAEDHVRRLCGGCHLGTRRGNRDDAARGGSGCAACHLEGSEQPIPVGAGAPSGAAPPHPAIAAIPGSDRCLGCHSRSARISLAYQGIAEVHPGGDCADPVAIFDGRPGCRQPEDVHHAAGLSCVDCHLHSELMGDGTDHGAQHEATELRCTSCHGPTRDETTWAAVDDPITATVLRRRGQERPPGEAVRTGLRGTPIWNLRPTPTGWALQPKAGGEARPVPPTPADPTHGDHGKVACQLCHAAWVPLCPACHTSYEPDGQQWDFGAGAERPGRWVEDPAPFGWGEPLIGRLGDRYLPAVPGMHATLEVDPGADARRVVRRFARAAPHTTVREARPCGSCHPAGSDVLLQHRVITLQR